MSSDGWLLGLLLPLITVVPNALAETPGPNSPTMAASPVSAPGEASLTKIQAFPSVVNQALQNHSPLQFENDGCHDRGKIAQLVKQYISVFQCTELKWLEKCNKTPFSSVDELLKEATQICPRFAACLRMKIYDDKLRAFTTVTPTTDVLREGKVCLTEQPNQPNWMDRPWFFRVEASYNRALQQRVEEKKYATRLSRGWRSGLSFLAGAGLIGGGVAIADLTERRLKLPYPTSCTSPLGVTGDPCFFSPAMRGVYIPMLVLGAALGVGGGLVLQYGHDWLYKESK